MSAPRPLDVGDVLQLGNRPQHCLKVCSLLPHPWAPAANVMDHHGRMYVIPVGQALDLRREGKASW